MKKTIFFVLSLMAVMGLLTGCRGKNTPAATTVPTTTATAPATIPSTTATAPKQTEPSIEESTLMPTESMDERATEAESTGIEGRNRPAMPNIR